MNEGKLGAESRVSCTVTENWRLERSRREYAGDYISQLSVQRQISQPPQEWPVEAVERVWAASRASESESPSEAELMQFFPPVTTQLLVTLFESAKVVNITRISVCLALLWFVLVLCLVMTAKVFSYVLFWVRLSIGTFLDAMGILGGSEWGPFSRPLKWRFGTTSWCDSIKNRFHLVHCTILVSTYHPRAKLCMPKFISLRAQSDNQQRTPLLWANT